MARARILKPGFFQNEDLAELHPFGRLLFEGLWLLADRAGRLEDRPKRIKAEVFPFDDLDIEPHLQALVSKGFVVRYRVAGQALLALPTFLKHQNPHKNEKESELPAPNTEEKHELANHSEPVRNVNGTRPAVIDPVLIPDPVPIAVTGDSRKDATRLPPRPKSNGRLTLHDWQLRELIERLGDHAEAFNLDDWIWNDLSHRPRPVFAARGDQWAWIQQQFTAEVAKRKLPTPAETAAQAEQARSIENLRVFNESLKASRL